MTETIENRANGLPGLQQWLEDEFGQQGDESVRFHTDDMTMSTEEEGKTGLDKRYLAIIRWEDYGVGVGHALVTSDTWEDLEFQIFSEIDDLRQYSHEEPAHLMVTWDLEQDKEVNAYIVRKLVILEKK